MNFDFLDRRSAESFAELLDESTRTRRHIPDRTDDRLAELVAIGHSLSATRPGVLVDPEFRVGLRAMLVATAERHGIGSTAVAVEIDPITSGPVPAVRSGLGGVFGQGGRRIRARGAIVIGVAAGAMAVSGISAASESASPGDALYGVKRSTERAQLAMAGSDVTRGQLSLDFARTRLAEAASMPGRATGFAGVLDDMDADTRKGVKLLNTSAVARRDVRPLATVDGFVAHQRETVTPALDKLSPANRERAVASLSLLDEIRRRTADLRTGLDCTPVVATGADTLGPKLRDCRSTAGVTSTPQKNGRIGKATPKSTSNGKAATVRPERSKPVTKPDPQTRPTDDARKTEKPDSTTIVPELPPIGVLPPATEPPAPIEDEEEAEGGLGGFLGDLFGQSHR